MTDLKSTHIIKAVFAEHFTPDWISEFDDTYQYGLQLEKAQRLSGEPDNQYLTGEKSSDNFVIPKLFFWTTWKKIKAKLDDHNVQLKEAEILPILSRHIPHPEIWMIEVQTDYDFVMAQRASKFEEQVALIPVRPELPPPPPDQDVLELTMSMCIDLPEGSVRNERIILWKKEFPNDPKGILLAVKYLMERDVEHPGVYYELLKALLAQVHEQYKQFGLMHLNELQKFANKVKKRFEAMADKGDRSDETVKKEYTAIAFGLLHGKLAEVNM
ncbi:hypothetical protein ACFL2U_01115 [Patescibacteria group bacterium]